MPGRLSTITCCANGPDMPCATSLPAMSAMPPGGGASRRMGLVGKLCAYAVLTAIASSGKVQRIQRLSGMIIFDISNYLAVRPYGVLRFCLDQMYRFAKPYPLQLRLTLFRFSGQSRNRGGGA